MGRYALMG